MPIKQWDPELPIEDIDIWSGDYNWQEAFSVSAGAGAYKAMKLADRSEFAADITDIAEVIASFEGAHDDDAWEGVFRLRDKRFLYLTAWCDYTGWDCQAGGEQRIGDTLEEVLEVIPPASRALLGLN